MQLRKPLTLEEIRDIQESGILRLIEFNITNVCNLACPGCYEEEEAKEPRQDLGFDTFGQYIDMGLERGLEEVWILGGEPTLHPQWREFLKYAKERGISRLTLFSNMLRLEERDIEFLIERETKLIGKMNIGSLEPGLKELYAQARAIGRPPEVARKMLDQVAMIIRRGLNGYDLFALENLLRKDNMPYAADFWNFCRQNNITPNLELFCGVSGTETIAIPDPEEVLGLIEEVRSIDRGYGIEEWIPMVPHILTGCPLTYTGIAVNYNEDVLPCAASKTVVANFQGSRPDYDVILDHPIMKTRRNISPDNIQGDCSGCDYFYELGCFGGCRTAAEADGRIHGTGPLAGYEGCITRKFIDGA